MRHLSLDERLALVEAASLPDHSHLRACPRCRVEVEEARASLGDARLGEMPEPSPLFWDHLSARVAEQIAAEPETPRRGRWFLRALVPSVVGVAALTLAVWIGRGPSEHATPPTPAGEGTVATVAADTTFLNAGDDESWSILGDMAGEFDVDTLSDSLGTSGTAGVAYGVYELNAEERASLASLLQAEIGEGPAAE